MSRRALHEHPVQPGDGATVPSPGGAEDWRDYGPVEYPRILEAALQAFSEHGYHGTTTRDLAQRSGLSVPGVYHYYPSKQDILFELMTVIIDELLTRSHQALDTAAPDPRAQFDALVESLLLLPHVPTPVRDGLDRRAAQPRARLPRALRRQA